MKGITAYTYTQLGLMLAGFITCTRRSIITHTVRSCQSVGCVLSVSGNPNATLSVCLGALSGTFIQACMVCCIIVITASIDTAGDNSFESIFNQVKYKSLIVAIFTYSINVTYTMYIQQQ